MNLQWNQAEQWQKRDPLLIAIILHPCLAFPFLVWIAAECLAGLFPLAFRWCRRVIGRPKVNRTTKTTTTNSSFQQSTDSCIRWSPVQILLLLIHWIKWGDSLSPSEVSGVYFNEFHRLSSSSVATAACSSFYTDFLFYGLFTAGSLFLVATKGNPTRRTGISSASINVVCKIERGRRHDDVEAFMWNFQFVNISPALSLPVLLRLDAERWWTAEADWLLREEWLWKLCFNLLLPSRCWPFHSLDVDEEQQY